MALPIRANKRIHVHFSLCACGRAFPSFLPQISDVEIFLIEPDDQNIVIIRHKKRIPARIDISSIDGFQVGVRQITGLSESDRLVLSRVGRRLMSVDRYRRAYSRSRCSCRVLFHCHAHRLAWNHGL